jgi:hypothetical protein
MQYADVIGWKERTDAALVQLLRGKLALNSREWAAQPSLGGALDHCENLQKHVALMLERVEALHSA